MRYAIKGNRPGTTLFVHGSTVKSQEDGTYRFSEAQLAELKRRKYEVLVVFGEVPAPAPTPEELEAQSAAKARIAATKAMHEDNKSSASRAPSKPSFKPKK